MQENMITTAFELPGYTITESLGIITGMSIKYFYYDKTMKASLDLIIKQAKNLDADAIIGLRYNSSKLGEVFVYGTAVRVNKNS